MLAFVRVAETLLQLEGLPVVPRAHVTDGRTAGGAFLVHTDRLRSYPLNLLPLARAEGSCVRCLIRRCVCHWLMADVDSVFFGTWNNLLVMASAGLQVLGGSPQPFLALSS
jgi:hypothetical protein